MQNFLTKRDTGLKQDRMLWVLAGVILLLSLLILPAYVDAVALQILDSELLSTLCGFVGWGTGAN